MKVAVVAGFQGLSPEGRITTLGRGGSDTTAVAFAAAFAAERCDIYTDVDGVYTTDPRVSSKAKKLDKIAFEEMLELASLGAKVLQTRSVELAMRFNVRLRVLSSFEDTDETSGTLVCAEEEIMESKAVSGIAFSRDEAKITLFTIEDRPGIAAAIFGPLAGKRERRHDRSEHLREGLRRGPPRRRHRHDLLLPDQPGRPRAKGARGREGRG